MLGWLLNLGYFLGAILASPLWLARMLRHGRYRGDWPARLGFAPKRYGLQPVIWIHGVSVGEVGAAKALVAQLHSQLPDYQVVVSSTTDTGLAAAGRLFAPDHVVFRWPLDLTFAVKTALSRLAPSIVVLMEGDVWPNFVGACRRRGVPVVVVNGRLGPRKGYPRYRLIRPLAAGLFNSLTAIGVQHEAYAEMFRALGVRQEKLSVTGMMKFDSAESDATAAGQGALAAAVGLSAGQRLLVAGGTGAGEEAMVLEVYDRLLSGPGGPNVRLAIVPRKPERFDEVARLIARRGHGLLRRSQCPAVAQVFNLCPPARTAQVQNLCHHSPDPFPVILGDTMGELRKFYGLSCGAFVGRSLVPEGGSDMFEAAALAKPVAFGPHTFNFPQAESMVRAGCAVRVSDATELAQTFAAWLSQPQQAAELGRKAQEFVRSQRGATGRNVELICRALGRVAAVAEGTIATDVVTSNQ